MRHRRLCIGLITAFYLLIGNALTAQGASKNDILLSAASPFEDLTEYALAANAKGMKLALKAYTDQASGVSAVLDAKARKDMGALIAAIEKAQSQGDDETVALKSVEAYRILVESLDANTLTVPVQVSLLDYAGFKFEVLLHARSTDWTALKKVAEEAKQNWAAIKPRVTDKGLRDALNTAIMGMYKACTEKNTGMALFAAQIDLALIDLLEGYFEQSSR